MRLTSNNSVSEMGMFDRAHNSSCKMDGKARYRDYDLDIDARELARRLLKDYADGDDAFTCDDDFDDFMMDCLQDGIDSIWGVIALFYRNLWAMADLHEKLKEFEDLEEQGRLLKLPCALRDKVYDVVLCDDGEYHIFEMKVCNINPFGDVRKGKAWNIYLEDDYTKAYRSFYDFGKTVFLTRREAELALRNLKTGRCRKYE